MKNYFFLIATSMIVSVCFLISRSNENYDQQVELQPKSNIKGDSTLPQELFNLNYAEKIMGEPMHLTDSTVKHEGGVLSYLSGYKANSEDKKIGRTGAIYFLFEQFDQIASAHDKYASTKTANEHNGIQTLDNLGDEAYFHTDGEHFYFIMVRKGGKVFNIKVNKITNTTSLKEFNAVAKKIVANI